MRPSLALLGALALAAVSGQALAAERANDRTTGETDAVAATKVAVAETGEDQLCNRNRRRLFVEGEGWIVRRVTTCR
ncbi:MULTISPECIES: hypothetical protein [Methylobacterium]|uniref:Uncharacterized protein n=1 Tax=Methylobacterium jeotgali TaxID=381630 RepID=A0ABQ4T0U7_9HYPH|nr:MULTISPECIES: hypothetical protein [Methylobacterium]GBU18229.1 hypothetical protein AwMethylo_24440 [Methylobacterium sp.]GJE08101.1 hypothetical protein AOPFMNJM_3435 [Methylobacterium jeotgali]